MVKENNIVVTENINKIIRNFGNQYYKLSTF